MRTLIPLFLSLLSVHAAPVSLFDGKTLAGWEGNTKVWRVENGVITGGSMAGNPHNEFLASKQEYRNFRLSLEYKLNGTDGFVNGGVQFRSQRMEQPAYEMIGYQADIGAGYTGFLYDESRRKKMLATADTTEVEKLEKAGEWNQYTILAEGSRTRIFLNGKQTVDYIETTPGIPETGKIALQIHGDCKAVIAYKNIVIEKLPSNLVPASEEIMQRFTPITPKPGNLDHPPTPLSAGKFSVVAGETIVFLGQENLVRAQKSGHLEASIASAWRDQNPLVRFMAWEGDTVGHQWRDLNFGSWADQLSTVGATTIFAQFGQTESFDGPEGLPAFRKLYSELLDQMLSQTPRLVLLSPTPFENPGGTLPNLTERNQILEQYVSAVREIAAEKKALFVDLFHPLKDSKALTDDGWHLNQAGLEAVAAEVSKALAFPTAETPAPALREAIVEKNRLFADSWRPANWSFVYGDRVSQPFAKSSQDFPSLRQTFEALRPLITQWDDKIHALTHGKDRAITPLPLTYPPTEEMPGPEVEKAAFTLAEGLEVNLFASEELGVAKPVQFIWDEKGRLWVACSPTYPHILPGKKPADFILVLEDTDGDGRADTSHRFAEGLTMVQGLELGDGGLYVCDFDRIIHLRDSDGDGKADQQETILAGFGIGDTHQLVNSISYGPAGNLWFSQGLHAFSRVETPHGLVVLEKAGVWRFDPRTRKLDPFFNGGQGGYNCWGVAFDDYQQAFHKTGDRPHGYWSVPGLNANPHPTDYHPVGPLFDSSPKTTSLDFVGTAALPGNLQGTALIAGYFGSLVEAHRLEDSGAGFQSEQLPRLLTSSSTAFRPVDISVGPDGGIYLADWFNPVIGHYQASYADPRRDRQHGRIWRISSKDHKSVKAPDLAGMDAAELLQQLHSPERWVRFQAKRLLFNLPSEKVVPSALAFVKKETDGRILMEATGVLQSHRAIVPQLPARLLGSEDFRVRSFGARLLGQWHADIPASPALFGKALTDTHPRVRLEAVVALSHQNSPAALSLILQSLDSPLDPFLDYAIENSVRALLPLAGTVLKSADLPATQRTYLEKLTLAPDAAPHPGKAVYESLCLNCHQPGGTGLPGVYPPLADSEWVQGDPSRAIRILLHGATGPLQVAGKTYGENPPIPMPPMGLDDTQIADVLSYLRTAEFKNPDTAITPEEVKTVRETHATRTTPWTAQELEQ